MDRNQVICGEASKVMASWPDESIDLTVTSPPYDNLRDYKGYDFPFEEIALELYRISKPGGVVVWVVNDATDKNGSKTGTSYKQALFFMEIGFRLHLPMIWEKTNPTPQTTLRSRRYTPSFEYMFVFSKGAPATYNPIEQKCKNAGKRSGSSSQRKPSGEKRPRASQMIKPTKPLTNVWQIPVLKNGSGHPAPFPDEIALRHIRSWSNPGDTILDPMAGSGTTLVAAARLGRKYLGIDISQDYCDMAAKRIEAETAQLSLDLPIIEPQPRPGLHQHGGDRRSRNWNQPYNCNHEKKRGNSAEYLIDRLRRDHPDILDRLHSGEFRSVRAAAIAAGVVRAREPHRGHS